MGNGTPTAECLCPPPRCQAGRALHKPGLRPEKALPGSFSGENEKIQWLMVCVMRPEIDDS